MCEVEYKEVTYGKTTYKIKVTTKNIPSQSAIKDCNRIVNDLMNKLY